jgi:hypothetical protein
MMFKMEELSFLRTFVDIDPHCPMSAHIKNINDLYIPLHSLCRRTTGPDRKVLDQAVGLFQSIYSDFVKIQDEVWENYREHNKSKELRK